MASYKVTTSEWNQDRSDLVDVEVQVTDDQEWAWLTFMGQLDEHDGFACGQTMAWMAWRYWGKGESVRCNGVAIQVTDENGEAR